jgi:hypothetical protein
MTDLRTLEIHWDPRVVVGNCDTRQFDFVLSMPLSVIFPALRTLVFSASNLATCTNFIKSIGSHTLESVSFVIGRHHSDNDISLLLDALSMEDKNHPQLTHISIRHYQSAHKVQNILFLYNYQSQHTPLTNITSTTLQPLLSRSNLIVLDINLILCSFDLDDAFLFVMATSLPSLQTLFLGHVFGWHDVAVLLALIAPRWHPQVHTDVN